jgi:hypothetical protein
VRLLAIYFGEREPKLDLKTNSKIQPQDSTARFKHNPKTQVLDGETRGTLQWVFIL